MRGRKISFLEAELAKPLLEVLRDVSLDPSERAAFAADPEDYLAQHGYEGVPPEDLGEAFGLMHDTLPADTAQALMADPVYEAPVADDPLAFGDAGEVGDMAPFGEVNGDFDAALADDVYDADDGVDDASDHLDLRTDVGDDTGGESDLGGDDDVQLGQGFDPDRGGDDDAGLDDEGDVGFGLGSADDGGDALGLDDGGAFGGLTDGGVDADGGDAFDDGGFGQDLFGDLDDVGAGDLHDTGAFGHDIGDALDGLDVDHGPDDDGLDDIGSF